MSEKKSFRTATAGEVDALQGAEAGPGVRCPACGCVDFAVKRTTWLKDFTIVRRRHCRRCGARITTREAAEK